MEKNRNVLKRKKEKMEKWKYTELKETKERKSLNILKRKNEKVKKYKREKENK